MMKQKTLKDCAICALAMALNRQYAEIAKDVKSFEKILTNGKRFGGTTDQTESAVLWKYGKKFKIYTTDNVNLIFKNGQWNRVQPKPVNFKKIIGNKKAIISVPSLNFKGYGHAIYWDGKKLHDPSNLKRYTAKNAFKRAYRAAVLV